MGKRSAAVELFLGDMGSIQRELRPSTQREDQLTMKRKLEQIAVKAVNQLPKSVVREIRTPRSVGAGGGRPPPATRWMWKRSHGGTIEAPPNERGGNRYVLPNATAPHLDSTVCHERSRSPRLRATVREMKEGPSGSAIRSLIPSHRELLRSKAVVVSVAETSGQ